MSFCTVEKLIVNTPLVKLNNIPGKYGFPRGNILLAKLEGNNPSGSIKDRVAWSMIINAEKRGELRKGDTIIEATSGNTGISLAMISSIRKYRVVLIMPNNLSKKRYYLMKYYGAEIILIPSGKNSMENARDVAIYFKNKTHGKILNQFSNKDNPIAHFYGTGPEIWNKTNGKVTHFVSAMGTSGTIIGVSRFLKYCKPEVYSVGVQPEGDSQIPGIRKWKNKYIPRILDTSFIDHYEYILKIEAEKMVCRLASEEGIFCGISSGGSLVAALRIAKKVNNSTIVFVVCDQGFRYSYHTICV